MWSDDTASAAFSAASALTPGSAAPSSLGVASSAAAALAATSPAAPSPWGSGAPSPAGVGPVSFSLVLATPGSGSGVGGSRLKVARGPGGGIGSSAWESAGEEEELVRWGSLQMAKRGKLNWVAEASSVRQQRGGELC
jgi:hypothetical protein